MSNLKPNDSAAIYSDPVAYDIESKQTTQDIPFYLRQAEKRGGPILEVTCGTGRVTIPLAKAGFQLTGIDISEPFIKRAQEKSRELGLDITWILGDCRDFHLNSKFPLIIMPFNAIAHIHDRESYEAMFGCVKEHLEPGGRFIFSWFNPDHRFLYRDPEKRYRCFEYELPDGTPVVVTENNVYDRATQINHIKWYYKYGDADEIVRDLNMRQLYPQELDNLLYYNGFELDAKYGDFEESPFEASSVYQVCVCKVRG